MSKSWVLTVGDILPSVSHGSVCRHSDFLEDVFRSYLEQDGYLNL